MARQPHKVRRDKASPLIVAHRGASADAPENTLEAFQLAWQQDADAIEGDFHLTADGKIVCHHDAVVQLNNGSKVFVRDLTHADLQSMTQLPVPALEDVLDTLPTGKGIFIEIKCGTEIIEPLLQTITRSRLPSQQVTIIAFNKQVVARIKQASPATQVNWLVDFKGSRLRLQPAAKSIIGVLKNLNADGVGIKADPRVSSKFVREIQSAGFSVHVWTVDSRLLARHFSRAGVASITTNIPGKMRSFLSRQEQSH